MRASLLRNADFVKLWGAQSVSNFGDQITFVALPLTAILVLNAGAAEMGVLRALQFAPILLFSLVAGVWIDRLRRRPILVAADLGLAALMGSVPVAAALGALAMPQLYVVGFGAGALAVIFQVAHQTYLPTLVRREQLVEANGRLQMSGSATQIAGPGVAGVLVAILTAPIAIAVDAFSFLVSAGALITIRAHEEDPAPAAARRSLAAEIREGMQALLGHRILRTLLISASLLLFCYGAQLAVEILYMSRDLGMGPVAIGTVFGAGSVGGLVGAASAGAAARRFGLGPSIIAANALLLIGTLLVASARGTPVEVAVTLVGAQVVAGFGISIYNVNGPSLRQALTPLWLLGRVNATYRFFAWGTTPLGALAGGVLAEVIGLRGTIALAGIGMLVPLAWVVLSPLRSLRSAPAESPA